LIRPLAGVFFMLGVLATPSHAQPAGVTIAGRIVADDTGIPLAHARLVIYNDATPLPAIFSDGEGRFATSPLPPGRYHLSATKAGYVLVTISRLSPPAPDAILVRMPRAASVSGRVFDVFGDPVSSIPVAISVIRTTGPPVLVKTVPTDDVGEYRFGGLASGSYVVNINNPLSLVGPNGPATASVTDPQAIQLAVGEQKSGVDFSGVPSLEALMAMASAQLAQQPNVRIVINGAPQPPPLPEGTGTIRGRITRGDGLAVARATVTAIPQRTPGDPRTSFAPQAATTDEDGKYEFTGLIRGSYRIRANRSGFTTAFYGERGTDQGAPIAVGDNQTRAQVDFVLPRHSAILGQVFDDFGDPVEGAIISVWQIRFQTGRRRLIAANGASPRATDDAGRYRVFGLPPGQYVVTASLGQLNTQGSGTDVSGFAPTYFPGTARAGEARLVMVPRSQDVAGINVALVPLPTARISGRKIGSDGQPMGGSLVLTESQRSGAIATPSSGARIAPDGRFEFPNVAPGEYVIQADSGKPNSGREGDFVSQFVTVNGTNVDNIVLQATPGSSISGRVVFDGDPPATPPRALSIEPARADPDRTPLSNGSIARGEVRPDLSFAIEGIHGPRRLLVNNPPPGWTLKSVLAGGVDVTDNALPFGTRDQSLSDVIVVLTNRVTELSGTVSDSHGQPALDYSLLIFPSDRDRWYAGSRFFRRAAAAQGGNFLVRGLPPGDYFVVPVSAASVLREGPDGWQDPEFLDSIALRGARATLGEGGKVSLNVRLITP
jgi:hypothetical protein